MKSFCLAVAVLLALALPATSRKAGPSVGWTAIRSFLVNDTNVVSLGAYMGCRNDALTSFATTTANVCKVPAGMQIRFPRIDMAIPVLHVPMGECRICIAIDGSTVTDLCIEVGDDDLNEAGEFKSIAPASPAWYGEGSEYTIEVIDTVTGSECIAGTSDIRRMGIFIQTEIEVAR